MTPSPRASADAPRSSPSAALPQTPTLTREANPAGHPCVWAAFMHQTLGVANSSTCPTATASVATILELALRRRHNTRAQTIVVGRRHRVAAGCSSRERLTQCRDAGRPGDSHPCEDARQHAHLDCRRRPGLYLAYLLHRQRQDDRIRIVEQNPPDSTFGFGVVFSDRALESLRDDDPETYDLLTP